MHRKLVIIDNEILFIGTANFTSASLQLHDNLVLGIYQPELCQALKNGFLNYSFKIGSQDGELWLLPDKSNAAAERVLQMIESAKKSVYIAMFTLTHPKLVEGLKKAARRGVDVKIAVDFYTGKGASAKSIECLSESEIPVLISRGQELFHHKWAYIDNKDLIIGSANWTRAAFAKNKDCFMILHNLTKEQRRYMTNLWDVVTLEATPKI